MTSEKLQKLGFLLRYEDDKRLISEIIKYMNRNGYTASYAIDYFYNSASFINDIFGDVSYVQSEKKETYCIMTKNFSCVYENKTIKELMDIIISLATNYICNKNKLTILKYNEKKDEYEHYKTYTIEDLKTKKF